MLNLIKDDYKKNKEFIIKIVKLISIFLLFFLIDFAQLIPIKIFGLKSISNSMTVILDTFKNLILMLLLFMIYRKDLIKDFQKFKAKISDNLDIAIKYWFVGLIGMIISNLIIGLFFTKGGTANNEQIVQSYITYLPWMMVIDAGIIAPFTEEMVFRKAFRNLFKNKWLFTIVTGLVFGSMHVIFSIYNWTDILYIIPYSFLGGAFALAYWDTDTIFSSYALHALHNTISIVSSIIALGFIF